ncbi:MAG: hypothetical protein HY435_02500 [Candidatus Liptonbacteria bacterium]|nr:hypothetical protein [Candidatus Liptonbacteria bacterium]
MARWTDRKDILHGPSEEKFLAALGRGAWRPVTFELRPKGTEIQIVINRIQRDLDDGEPVEFIFYGRTHSPDPKNSRQVRGYYIPFYQSGGLGFRA